MTEKKTMDVIIIPVAEGVEYREIIILYHLEYYQISHIVSWQERSHRNQNKQLNTDKVS